MEANNKSNKQSKTPESWLHAIPERWRIGIPLALVVGGAAFAFTMMEKETPAASHTVTPNYANIFDGQP